MSETIQRYEMRDTSRGYDAWQELVRDDEGEWVRYEDHVTAMTAARAEIEAMTTERDEHKAKWQAIYDVRAFPRPAEVLQLLQRLPRRDAEVIDRAFAEGATLLAAAEFEHRRLRRAHDQLAADLAAVRKVEEWMLAFANNRALYAGDAYGNVTGFSLAEDGSTEVSAPTIPALGRALAAQEGANG